MSFGALSANAVLALNKGAALGGFAHGTGEGGLSEYHLRHGGDLIWDIGTGSFGCRTEDGEFAPSEFADKAAHERIKCLSLKISQGAEPGIGGVLPGSKVNAEVARIREVPQGRTIISPPSHRTFATPRELVLFLARRREPAGGKPTGFKLCVGSRREFLSVCKAMPANALVGCGLRDRIKIGASGKVATGADMVKRPAQGADYTNAARAMMRAVVASRHSAATPTPAPSVWRARIRAGAGPWTSVTSPRACTGSSGRPWTARPALPGLHGSPGPGRPAALDAAAADRSAHRPVVRGALRLAASR